MHCERCLKSTDELEPTGPFRERMCNDCREVFAQGERTAAAALELERRPYTPPRIDESRGEQLDGGQRW